VSGAAAGPFEMADFAGLDSDYSASESIYNALGRPERLLPSATEQRLVQYGQLGRKTTIGFYIYEDGRIVGENPILPNLVKYLGLKKTFKDDIFAEIMRPVVEEARLLASEIMASEYDIETAAKLAFNWPKGPFAFSRDMAHLMEKKKVSEFDRLDTF
jgi:3-hydroxybutyryl-CoA dehydrogenase